MPRPTTSVPWVFLVMLLTASCGPAEEPPPETPTGHVTEPPEAPTPPSDPSPADDCEPMIVEVTRVLESGSVACSETADCGCYSGGMGSRSACGGIANRDTLSRLGPIAVRFRATDCYPTVNCAAWECTPTCEDGQCRNPRGGGRAGPSTGP